MTEPTQEFMTAEEVAVMFRMSASGIRKLARQGKLPCIKLGRDFRFNRAEILKLGRVPEGEVA